MGNSNRSQKSLLMRDLYQEYEIDYGHIRGTNLSDCTLQSFGLNVKSFELKYCLGVWSNFCPKKCRWHSHSNQNIMTKKYQGAYSRSVHYLE